MTGLEVWRKLSLRAAQRRFGAREIPEAEMEFVLRWNAPQFGVVVVHSRDMLHMLHSRAHSWHASYTFSSYISEKAKMDAKPDSTLYHQKHDRKYEHFSALNHLIKGTCVSTDAELPIASYAWELDGGDCAKAWKKPGLSFSSRVFPGYLVVQ